MQNMFYSNIEQESSRICLPAPQTRIPLDVGRTLKVHETFRGRAGRLLNVLCRFNLRPVSRGYDNLGTYIVRQILARHK